MKAALIPPIPALRRFGNGNFHLLLSHLLEDARYTAHYREQRLNGAYLVLDNSAHENGWGNNPEELMFQACQMNAQEVVVPDVLEDAGETIEGAIAAHECWFDGRPSPTDIVREKVLMYVPQGKDYADWKMCLANLVRVHLYTARRYGLPRSFVIGVSKDYEVWDGGIMRLLDEDIYPLKASLDLKGVRMQVHLLGWGRQLWELEKIAAKHKWIRSTDSAKPFVYGLERISLWSYLQGDPPVYPKRDHTYFERHFGPHAATVSLANCALFKALASGNRSNTVAF